MKKNIERILLALILLASPLLTSCDNFGDDNDEVSFFPLQVAVIAQNANGDDCLSPSNNDNIERLKGVVLTYQGKSYNISNLSNFGIVSDATRATLPILFNSLQLTQYNTQTGLVRYALVFGQLDGAKNYDGETFTVNWPSGEVDVLEYWRQINGKEVKEWATLNGKEVNSLTISRVFETKNLN